MPKRRERALLYIRESDITLAMDSTTIESAKQALLAHAEKKGYEVSPDDIHIETISAYHTYYFDRPELMKALKKVERGDADVFLVTEIRALSRRGAGEVLVIYNILQKANVRLETLSETITDDPMGEVLLTFRATWARIEREQSYIRMQRGKKDRLEIGKAPPNGHRCYGFILVDTEKEVKGRYEFDHEIVYVDADGIEWSRHKARTFLLASLEQGQTLHATANKLNDLGIPPPRKSRKVAGVGCWTATTVQRIAESAINIGEVWVNQYKKVGKKLVKRPKEEWILLPEGTAPAMITREAWEEIKMKIKGNKQDSLRNNQHQDELGLLRAGYIFCGVCGRRMIVKYPSIASELRRGSTAIYRCQQKDGKTVDVSHNHRTQVHVPGIDTVAKEKIIEVLLHPEEVRKKVDAIRQANKPLVDQAEIAQTIADIKRKMQNLYTLAEKATDDETIVHLAERMNELETQKRETEKLLYVLEDDAEERAEIEKEVQKFEAWAAKVQPFLTNREYMAKATYTELRLAVKILGIRATVYPTNGQWPYRYQVEVTVPQVLAKMDIVSQFRAGSQQNIAFFRWIVE